MILKDTHYYVFCIFLVSEKEGAISLDDHQYLGTGFFVTPNGDAVTAAHVVPTPDQIPKGKTVIAMIRRDEGFFPCYLNHALITPSCDFALLKINIDKTPFLEVSFDQVLPGSDVVLLGYPDHELHRRGKELRILKSHVTLSHQKLEIGIPIPVGMSGCPVFFDDKVIGFSSGTNTSESIEESTEEIQFIENNKEKIVISQIKKMTHYGIVWPFSSLAHLVEPGLNNMTFKQFLDGSV